MNRRRLLTGLVSFVVAPAIVRASSLMPVKASALVAGLDLARGNDETILSYFYKGELLFSFPCESIDEAFKIAMAHGSLEGGKVIIT